MKKYRVKWTQIRYGESYVLANNEEEAKERARKEEDFGWDELEPESPNWCVDDVEEDDEQECEYCGIEGENLFEVRDETGYRAGVCKECVKYYSKEVK